MRCKVRLGRYIWVKRMQGYHESILNEDELNDAAIVYSKISVGGSARTDVWFLSVDAMIQAQLHDASRFPSGCKDIVCCMQKIRK